VDKPVNSTHYPSAVVSFDKVRYFQRITLPVELSNRLLEFVLSPCRRHRNDLIRAERLTNLFHARSNMMGLQPSCRARAITNPRFLETHANG
jgi:hypothetical protein